MPGLARRLRTVTASVGGTHARARPLRRARASLSDAQLLVLAAAPASAGRDRRAARPAPSSSLAADGLIAPEVTIGWGEPAAAALSATSASMRLFVLPTGRLGPPLAPPRSGAARAPACWATNRRRARWSRSAAWAPTPSSRPAPAPRAPRKAIPAWRRAPPTSRSIAVRFGCDDPPNDPATDPALPANFSAATLSRQGRVPARPRAPLLAGARPANAAADDRARFTRDGGADAILGGHRAAGAVRRRDGDRPARRRPRWSSARACSRSAARARRAAVPGVERRRRAACARGAADAILLGDDHDRTGRAAGLALLYGTLPIAPDVGANHDYLVDYDPRSRTGHAILYSDATPFEIESAVRRAITLRADGDVWTPLVKALLASAPRWSAAAAADRPRSRRSTSTAPPPRRSASGDSTGRERA